MNAKTSSLAKIGRPATIRQPERVADAGVAAELLRLRRGGQPVVGQRGVHRVGPDAIPSWPATEFERGQQPMVTPIRQAHAELSAGDAAAEGRTLEHALAIAD
jgi:hypothetical protein